MAAFSPSSTIPRRQLGSSDLWVSPVAFGCWPISGISTLGADDRESLATIRAAIDSGINHFDTAYSYGYQGESDRLLREAIGATRDHLVIASKVGTHYNHQRQRLLDASPERINREVDEIRSRLALEQLDLLYLHTPDGVTPIEESAAALSRLVEKQVVRYVGVSNITLEELRRFASVIQPIVVQQPFNMLQPEGVTQLLPYLQDQPCGVAAYWPLMKGLLAGAMQRDHVLEANDKRRTYPIFQGQAWHRAQDLLDVLRDIAAEHRLSVPQLVVHWTLRQPNITTVLCGAKRPEQIRQSASAMNIWLDNEAMLEISNAIQETRCGDRTDPSGSG
jgi:aryl-alcohol dehydrogenase-like predicted oxidoreductase